MMFAEAMKYQVSELVLGLSIPKTLFNSTSDLLSAWFYYDFIQTLFVRLAHETP